MKYVLKNLDKRHAIVAPARERGLKCVSYRYNISWCHVAPARERGLKSADVVERRSEIARRSREGAWIEIGAAISIPP